MTKQEAIEKFKEEFKNKYWFLDCVDTEKENWIDVVIDSLYEDDWDGLPEIYHGFNVDTLTVNGAEFWKNKYNKLKEEYENYKN